MIRVEATVTVERKDSDGIIWTCRHRLPVFSLSTEIRGSNPGTLHRAAAQIVDPFKQYKRVEIELFDEARGVFL